MPSCVYLLRNKRCQGDNIDKCETLVNLDKIVLEQTRNHRTIVFNFIIDPKMIWSIFYIL